MSETVILTAEQKRDLRPGTRIWGDLPYAGQSSSAYANKMRYYLVAGCTKDGIFVFDVTSDKSGHPGRCDYSQFKPNFFLGRLPTESDPNKFKDVTFDAINMGAPSGQANFKVIQDYALSTASGDCPGIMPFTKGIWVKCDSLRFVPASLYNVHNMAIAGSTQLDSQVLDQIFYKTAIGFVENAWKNKSGMTLETAPKSVQRQAKQYKADQEHMKELREQFDAGKQLSFADYQAMEHMTQILDLYHSIPKADLSDTKSKSGPAINPHVLELLGGMIDNPEQAIE